MEFSAPKRLLLWNPPVKPPGTHRIHTRHLSLRDRLARLRVSVSFHMCLCGVWHCPAAVEESLPYLDCFCCILGEFNKACPPPDITSLYLHLLCLIFLWLTSEIEGAESLGESTQSEQIHCLWETVICSRSLHSAASLRNLKFWLSCCLDFAVVCQATPAVVRSVTLLFLQVGHVSNLC